MINSNSQHYSFDDVRKALRNQDAEWINQFEAFDSLRSSNDYLMRVKEKIHGRVCIANYQSQGKGRHGKRWQSEAGSSLMFSLGWRPKGHLKAETSLVVGVALVDALQQLGITEVGLKWPNDVLVKGGKIAGILLESRAHNRQLEVVMGIGLNLLKSNMPIQGMPLPSISMGQLGIPMPDRQKILITILIALAQRLDQFETSGFEPIRMDWLQYHILQDKQVSFLHAGEARQGKIIGLDVNGALMLKSNYETLIVNSGEVSSIRGVT